MRGYMPYWANSTRLASYSLHNIIQKESEPIHLVPDIFCPNKCIYMLWGTPKKVILSNKQFVDYNKFLSENKK
jgi:hypothetical protein